MDQQAGSLRLGPKETNPKVSSFHYYISVLMVFRLNS